MFCNNAFPYFRKTENGTLDVGKINTKIRIKYENLQKMAVL